jgi:hypothetical protein
MKYEGNKTVRFNVLGYAKSLCTWLVQCYFFTVDLNTFLLRQVGSQWGMARLLFPCSVTPRTNKNYLLSRSRDSITTRLKRNIPCFSHFGTQWALKLSLTDLSHHLYIIGLFYTRYECVCEPGSSVGIVSGYGLDDRAIEVRFPAKEKDFSSILCVQTGSGAHPAYCTMGTGGPFPGTKARPGRDADNSPPSSAEVENE